MYAFWCYESTLFGARKVRFFGARLNPFLGVYGKNEDYHRLRFFVLFVVVYFVFSVYAFFMEKIAKHNRLFRLFSKKPKHVSWKWL